VIAGRRQLAGAGPSATASPGWSRGPASASSTSGRLAPDGDGPDGLGREVSRERADAFLYTVRPAGASSAPASGAACTTTPPAYSFSAGDDLALEPGWPSGPARPAEGPRGDRHRRRGLGGGATTPSPGASRWACGRAPDRHAILGYDAMPSACARWGRAGSLGGRAAGASLREALSGPQTPRARFVRYRVEGNRLVTLRPPM
jgi:hypothetical protein